MKFLIITLAGILLNNYSFSQVTTYKLDKISEEVSKSLPGVQKEIYLIDAEENNGNSGYLVFKIYKKSFDSAMQSQIGSNFVNAIYSLNILGKICNGGSLASSRFLSNSITASENKRGASEFKKIGFDNYFRLNADYQYEKWVGGHGVVSTTDQNSKLLEAKSESDISFIIESKNTSDQSESKTLKVILTSHLKVDFPFRECSCFFNWTFSKCQKGIDTNVSTSNFINFTDGATPVQGLVNIASEVGITSDSDFYYIYLCLKK